MLIIVFDGCLIFCYILAARSDFLSVDGDADTVLWKGWNKFGQLLGCYCCCCIFTPRSDFI